MTDAIYTRLADLLAEAASAHHEYEVDLGEPDPRWPEWYAEWMLKNGLEDIIEPTPDKLALTNALVGAEKFSERIDPDKPWEEFYAAFILGRFGEYS